MKIGWLQPTLSNKRKITAYELQVCQPMGALCKNYTIYKTNELSDELAAPVEVVNIEFTTLTNSSTQNYYVVREIKPGHRYQYRVRPQINKVWLDWDYGMLSSVIVVPACAPDSPTDIKLWSGGHKAKSNIEGEVVENKAEVGSLISFDNEGVSHDFIVIQFIAGNSGGASVTGYRIEYTKIKAYDYRDIVEAQRAAGIIISDADHSGPTLPENTVSKLHWSDATPSATMMGPTAFKINNLNVGTHYIFRMQQKNEVGWSKFSAASPILSTCHTPPPNTPVVTELGAKFAVIQWTTDPLVTGDVDEAEAAANKALNNFTVLDYQIAVGHISSDDMAGLPISNYNATNLTNSLSNNEDARLNRLPNVDATNQNVEWRVGKTRLLNRASVGDFVSCVLVDDLAAGSYYALRVKVFTIAGWSPWSSVCDTFRTLSVQ